MTREITAEDVLEWLTKNEEEIGTISSWIGKYHARKRGPVDGSKMVRSKKNIKKANDARWKGHKKKAKPKKKPKA